MIEKFATDCCKVQSELLDLNHTSESMMIVLLMIPKFAAEPRRELGRTSETEH